MTVTNIHKDAGARTLTITATLAGDPERVWQLWADPRQLERWWGPPTYPATVVDHDLRPGGRVTYYMTGPEGDRHFGWWNVGTVDPPHHLTFEDGFADDQGNPNLDLPVTLGDVRIAANADGSSTMTMVSTFATTEAMQQLLAMGMLEGITAALNQMDALVAAAA